MTRIKRGIIGVAAGVLAAALALPSRAAELDHWRHGLLDAKSDAGILYMIGQGFAKKQGLDLKLLQFHNDVIEFQALESGELDSYEGGPEAISGISRGAEVRIVGCHWPGLPHGIFAADSIKTVKDLIGKTIAVSAPNSMPDVLAHLVLQEHNVPVSEVRIASLGNDGDRYKALVAGIAQAAVVSREYMPFAKRDHVHFLVSGQEAMPNYMRICIVMSEKTIKERPKDAARFLAAEMNALHYALTHRDAALKLTEKMAKTKPGDPRPAYMYDWAVKDHAVDPTLGLHEKKLEWMENELLKLHKLAKPVPIDHIIDGSVRAAALKLTKQ